MWDVRRQVDDDVVAVDGPKHGRRLEQAHVDWRGAVKLKPRARDRRADGGADRVTGRAQHRDKTTADHTSRAGDEDVHDNRLSDRSRSMTRIKSQKGGHRGSRACAGPAAINLRRDTQGCVCAPSSSLTGGRLARGRYTRG
jgi:hypothetical protein